MLVGLYMYRQLSKCIYTDKTIYEKAFFFFFWGGGQVTPLPPMAKYGKLMHTPHTHHTQHYTSRAPPVDQFFRDWGGGGAKFENSTHKIGALLRA